MQVAGFHSASHSTTLDKIYLYFTYLLYHMTRYFSRAFYKFHQKNNSEAFVSELSIILHILFTTSYTFTYVLSIYFIVIKIIAIDKTAIKSATKIVIILLLSKESFSLSFFLMTRIDLSAFEIGL